jgi:hypothetical protein
MAVLKADGGNGYPRACANVVFAVVIEIGSAVERAACAKSELRN